jgi:hypothetical protein
MGKTDGQIRFLNCGKWISSPIAFGSSESFFSSTLIGNKLKCPSCTETTDCNKENMRFTEEMENSGGFRVTYYEGEMTFDKKEN